MSWIIEKLVHAILTWVAAHIDEWLDYWATLRKEKKEIEDALQQLREAETDEERRAAEQRIIDGMW